MGKLNPAEWSLGVRRAMPFVAFAVLGLLAWQLPVVAELDGDEQFPELAVQLRPTVTVATTLPPVTTAPSTTAPAPTQTELASPPTTRRTSAPTFRPTRPTPAPTTTTTTAPVVIGDPGSPTTTAPPPRITGPLRITKSTWGQNAFEPTTSTRPIPDGVLPVELANYLESRQSYVEVRGSETSLNLQLSDQESGTDASEPLIKACEIATGFWNDRSPGASFEDSPAHNPEKCVTGAANGDGTWTFDLSSFGDLNTHSGFALIPISDGSLGTFSDWFERPAAP